MLLQTRNRQTSGRVTRPGERFVAGLLAVATALSMPLTGVAFANVVGVDMQNFNPTTDGLDFVTVESSQTLDPGVINFGLFLNYAVNSLPYFDDPQGNKLSYSDSLLSADLNVGVGLLSGLDFGIDAPQVLMQDVEGDDAHGQFAETGNTMIRVNAKWRFYGDREGGLAAVVTEEVNRVQNNPYLGANAGPTTDFQLVADTTVNRFRLALNLGYRLRQSGTPIAADAPIEPISDEYIASGALSYLFSSIDTKLIVEIFGSRPVANEGTNAGRESDSAEALIGLKHDFTTHLSGHIGAGSGLIYGTASPDWRIYAGLNYALGPVFSKPQPVAVQPSNPNIVIKADPFSGPPKAHEKIVIHDILFEFDSDSLVIGGADDTLHRLVNYLNTKPVFTKLVIEGHTDSIGSDQYNLSLSKRRAETIKRWLVERYHLPASKIEAIGKGKRFPIADNGNYQGRQLNRRVEFTIFRDMKH